MEFACARDEMLFGVKTVGRALGAGSSMPILSGIKMEVKGDRDLLKLYATDLERAIQCSMSIENKGEDETVILNGDILSKITSRLPDEPIGVRTVEGKIELICGGVTFDLFTMPLEDYPEIPALPEAKICSLRRDQLQRGLDQTTFAALPSRETSRLSLTGVNMVLKESSLKLVATNGYRLALKEELLPGLSLEGEYLVDSDSLKDLQSILAQGATYVEEDEVGIYHDGAHLFFKTDKVIFIAKLISEEYPDFEKVIPRENKIDLVLDRREFLAALQRVEITTAEESGAVILKAGGEKLTISSSSAEKGEAEEVLKPKKPSEEIEVSFRGEYLIEALKRMNSSEVTFWLADSESAGLVEPSQDEEGDSGFIYVCMPIRMD